MNPILNPGDGDTRLPPQHHEFLSTSNLLHNLKTSPHHTITFLWNSVPKFGVLPLSYSHLSPAILRHMVPTCCLRVLPFFLNFFSAYNLADTPPPMQAQGTLASLNSLHSQQIETLSKSETNPRNSLI